MPKDAVIIPPLGHKWVPPRRRTRLWGKRIYKHSGGQVLSIPAEAREQLGWENGDMLLMEVVGDELRVHKPKSLVERPAEDDQ